jgi:hypothetical protein
MTARLLVTIGTDEVWASPKEAILEVNPDLVVTNINEIGWTLYERARVTRLAYCWRGDWRLCRTFAAVAAVRNQRIRLGPGAVTFRMNYDGPPVEVDEAYLLKETPEPAELIRRAIGLLEPGAHR